MNTTYRQQVTSIIYQSIVQSRFHHFRQPINFNAYRFIDCYVLIDSFEINPSTIAHEQNSVHRFHPLYAWGILAVRCFHSNLQLFFKANSKCLSILTLIFLMLLRGHFPTSHFQTMPVGIHRRKYGKGGSFPMCYFTYPLISTTMEIHFLPRITKKKPAIFITASF